MKSEILIVGAGPVGMVLACVLAQSGVKVKIVDKREQTSSIPRAINVSSPVLKIFDELGIGQRVLTNGLKLSELKAYWDRKPLLNINYKYYKPVYPYFLHLEQSKIECYLSDRLREYGVQVERGISVKDMVVNKSNISVRFTTSSGDEWGENYSYVIGCDGGNSTVRELAGIDSVQEKYQSHFILVDGEVEHQFENGLNQLHYYLTDDGYLIVAPLPGRKCRMIASLKGRLSDVEPSVVCLEKFQEIMNTRGPNHLKLNKIIWGTSGNFFHRIAETARKGNIFLAGDAIHQFSPVGGANMNVGIQDAFSLGQKLIGELREMDYLDCLMAYSSERLKVAKHYIETTASMTRLLTRSDSVDSQDELRFMPKMKNRKFLKYTLPAIFSGEHFIS
jgi:2-polyprenyl-6-methoxyphenol hydroxylase-like FAD-dependent oxidoreductase